MRRLLFAALFAALGLFAFNAPARAVDITRVCVPVYDSQSGALNCQDNGWQPKLLAALTNTAVAIKASKSGVLGTIYCYNSNATAAFVQVFDVATASGVTVGTTAPVLSLGLAPASAGSVPIGTLGVHFANGIQIAATTTATGGTALASALDCSATYN